MMADIGVYSYTGDTVAGMFSGSEFLEVFLFLGSPDGILEAGLVCLDLSNEGSFCDLCYGVQSKQSLAFLLCQEFVCCVSVRHP